MQVVIDTDPGIDDGVALLFALTSPAFKVLGITTVAGNIGLPDTTRNAARLLAAIGRADVPVMAGAATPLRRPAIAEVAIHGTDGFGDLALPEPAVPAGEGAVDWLAALLMREPPGQVDVLALGPLTNLAALILRQPEAARRLRRIIAMAGTLEEPGNAGPAAEFNLAWDPEAAEIVLGAGLPLTLIPLDVTRKVWATPGDCTVLRESGRPAAELAARLIEAYSVRPAHHGLIRTSRPLHDPCVMLLAEAPELFGCEAMGLGVDCAHGETAGRITRDGARPAVRVVLMVDAPAALALLARRLTA